MKKNPMMVKVEKGERGDPGPPGRDAVANINQIINVVDNAISNHEHEFNHFLIHDSRLLGTKYVDETNIGDGKVLQVAGNTLRYIDLPKEIDRVRREFFVSNPPTNTFIYVASVTSNYTIGNNDHLILVNASSGALTITLPTAVNNDGKNFYIKKTDSSDNFVTIATTSSETIDGLSTQTLPVQYSILHVAAYNSVWHIV